MLQIVHAYFKAVGGRLFAQLVWRGITAFRNEIEAGAEAQVHFELHEAPATVEPFFPFHIMCQDKSETLAIGPAKPPRGRSLASLFYWPVTCVSDAPAAGTPPAKSDAQRQWHEGFDVIIAVLRGSLLNHNEDSGFL